MNKGSFQEAFQNAYTQLNTAQKEAVDNIEGPVMVVAGPGTGKTQILTLRIANILLKTQINPSNILALTFTQAAAYNMRERLLSIIGPEAHQVAIFTFHAFCSEIIEEHPDDFWHLLGKKVADEVQKVEVMEKLIDAGSFEHIRPFNKPYYYVSEIIRVIGELKREGVSPQEFKQLNDADRKAFENTPDKESTRIKGKMKGVFQTQLERMDKNDELYQVYDRYDSMLSDMNLYDFDDLIVSVLGKLTTDEDFRLRIMEKYQYILVDEHQDSNNAQNKIIQLLTSHTSSPNVFVVGDEKQAIFRFQGASVENFRSFKKLYPDARLITLTENYRSTQTILDGAVGLLTDANKDLLKKQATHPEKPIQIAPLSTPAHEYTYLAQEISKDIEEDTAPNEIAVLVRTRAQVKAFAQALASSGVSVHIDVDDNIFESAMVKKLIVLLEAVHLYADDTALFKALHLDFLGFPPLDLYRLTQAVSRKRYALGDLLSDEKRLDELHIGEAQKMHLFFKRLGDWYLYAKNEPVHSLMHKVLTESKLYEYALKNANPILSVAPIRELFDHISLLDQQHNWQLADFFTYLEKVHEHHISVRVKIRTQPEGKVLVMTAHSAKGLEFDHVYIPCAIDAEWGGRTKRKLFHLPFGVYGLQEQAEDDDDERRLFFVALTRARKKLTVSYALTKEDGSPTLPTRYLEEIPSHLKQNTSYAHEETSWSVMKPTIDHDTFEQFKSFVKESFAQYGMSVSALNNYLLCPWKYFYTNLVRVPSGKDKTLMFGNAVHNALTLFYKHYKETGEKSCDYLLTAFEQSASQELFTRAEINDALVRGKQILTDYFRYYEDSFSRNVLVKFRIPEVFLEEEKEHKTERIKLTGELDLIEFLDASLQKVRVIDFKTGKPRSRNDILGETKNSDGNYYRQLVFYKLLLSYFKPVWNVHEEVLDFVQSDGKGTLHKEVFMVEDEEVTKLRDTVKTCAHEIVNLSFWDEHCDDTACQWCDLRKSLNERVVEGGLF